MKQEGFAKLIGYDLDYYMQTLSIILGRTPNIINKKKKDNIDLQLGKYRNISRKHAKIQYNFEKKIFEITCYG
jgi:hypothetical protein